MTSARAIEYRITQNLLERRTDALPTSAGKLTERLICVSALAGGMLLFGSLIPELLVALLAAGAVAALGSRAGQ